MTENTMPLVTFETLGCKLNQAETEMIARQFTSAGCRLGLAHTSADIYVLNTCTVTHVADRKARHLLRLARRRSPNALLVVTGCYVERCAEELAALDDNLLVLANCQKDNLAAKVLASGLIKGQSVGRGSSNSRQRAMIKVQSGCQNFCAYCIVPLVRPQDESLPVEAVIATINERVTEGCREVVLTGTEIGAYNHNGTGLVGLVRQVLSETKVERLRLSSLQPQQVTPELLKLWEDSRLCRHFHLSLQSGSDGVLKRMKRRCATGDYSRAVSRIRQALPQAAITTDVIVGFPGETEAECAESLNFCRQMGFARIHVFAYSSRPGTAAAKMSGQVKAPVKKERSQQMMALAAESGQTFRQGFSGKVMTVLWEQKKGGLWSGLTDNYIKVYTKSGENLANRITKVKLEGLHKDGVMGVEA